MGSTQMHVIFQSLLYVVFHPDFLMCSYVNGQTFKILDLQVWTNVLFNARKIVYPYMVV